MIRVSRAVPATPRITAGSQMCVSEIDDARQAPGRLHEFRREEAR